MKCGFAVVKFAVVVVLLLTVRLKLFAAPNSFGFELEFLGGQEEALIQSSETNQYGPGSDDLKLNPNAPNFLSQLVDQEMTGNKEVRSVGGEVSLQEVYSQMKSLKKILAQKEFGENNIKSIHIHEFIYKENILDRRWFNSWNLYFADLIFAWRLENLKPGLVLLSRSVGRNLKTNLGEKGTIRVIEHKDYFDVEFRGMNKDMDELYRMMVLYNQGLNQPQVFGVSESLVDDLRQTQSSFEEFIQNLLKTELTQDQLNKLRYFTYQISAEKNLTFITNLIKIVPAPWLSQVTRSNQWLARKILFLLNNKKSTELDFFNAIQAWSKQVRPYQILLKFSRSQPLKTRLDVNHPDYLNKSNSKRNPDNSSLNVQENKKTAVLNFQDQIKADGIKKYYQGELSINEVLKLIGHFDKMTLRILKQYIFVFPETEKSNRLFDKLMKIANNEVKNLMIDGKKQNIILAQGSLKGNKFQSNLNPVFYLPSEKKVINRCQNIY